MLRPCAILCSLLFVAAVRGWSDDEPPPLPPLIHQLTLQAGKFWGEAPSWYGRETLRQSGPFVKRPRRGFHLSVPPPPAVPEMAKREIVSWYGFSAQKSNSEAIHEIRQVIAIDGKPVPDSRSAADFCHLLQTRDDFARQELADKFEEVTLGDVPLDFGQLVMLFTRRAIDRYTFHKTDEDMIGAEPVSLFQYTQQTGTPGLHLDENKTIPMAGTVALRNKDGMPLRIVVVATRIGKDKIEVRDEAQVEYQEVSHGVMLPVALTHQRYVKGALQSDDRAVYSDWKPVQGKK